MKLVTDPEILAQLNAPEEDFIPDESKEVTDPEILKQLNAPEGSHSAQSKSYGIKDQFNYYKNNPAQYLKDALATSKGVGKNFLEVLKGEAGAASNLGRNLANLIPGVNLPETRFGEGPAYRAGEVLGDIGTFMGGGAGLEALRGASEGLPLIGEAAKSLGGNGISGLARRALGSALYGSVQNPEHREKGAVEMGLVSALTDAALGGLSKLRPSQLLRGNLTPEQLLENLKATQGTRTHLGEVIESPTLKFGYENLISKAPFSGADTVQTKLKHQIEEKGANIVNKYLGNTSPEHVSKEINNALKIAAKEQSKLKTKLYETANETAKKVGLKMEFPKFEKNLKQNEKILNDQNFLIHEPKSKKILNKIALYKLAPEMEGGLKNKSPTTLEEANILKGTLRREGKKYLNSGNPSDQNFGISLIHWADALKKDIYSSIEKSGSKQLSEEYIKAEENYAKKYVPYLEKDIKNFLNEKKSSEDLIQHFIVTGPNSDKGQKLNKLMSKLSPKAQDLVKYAYFSRALHGPEHFREISPESLRTLWGDKKLGINQRKALVPDKSEREKLNRYARLVNLNENSLKAMFNPHTGARTTQALIMALLLKGGALLPLGGAHVAQRLLTSPKIREDLVHAMLGKESNLSKKGKILSETARKTLVPLLGNLQTE